MSDVTLESLAARVAALEAVVGASGAKRPDKDWRRVVGMFAGSEFMRAVDEEGQRLREAERDAARRGAAPE